MDGITLTFLGGAGDIGASATLVEAGATTLLIDCGVRFEPGNELPDLSLLYGKKVDAIIATHAHSDHTGGLPVLCEAFPAAPVYATPPTVDITSILLRDALKLMNAPDREGVSPIYNEAQLERVGHAWVPLHVGRAQQVGAVQVVLLPAAHILGAAMVHLATPHGNVLFTGDYSVSAQATVPALDPPTLPTDLVVSEATYGDRLHEDRGLAEKRLLQVIREVVADGGKVLIPAFAVGRAQEVLLILKRALRNGQLPALPVYVDGMVRAVCGVYAKHERYGSRALSYDIRHGTHPFFTNGITPVGSPEERAAVLSGGPAVIVASSGMLAGGASVAYATALACDPRHAIVFTGYQDEESPGRALLRLLDASGPREIKLGGHVVSVACRVATYGLSAHADRMQMAAVLGRLRPRTVVLVHGDAGARRALAQSLDAQDIVLAENGMTLTRAYRRGRAPVAPPVPPATLDVARLRALLGPPGETPLRVREVAYAYWGERRTAHEVEGFTTALVELGLVRRDDQRRAWAYVLGPCETHAFPEEAAVEAELRETNPKGRLAEWCQRQRVALPEFEMGVDGAYHTATAALDLGPDGERVSSGTHRAASKKTAEQLAAQALLAEIGRRVAAPQHAWVDEAEGARLRNENPKGRLLEWAAQTHVAKPRFEVEALPGGFAARAVWLGGGHRIASGWHAAAVQKTAEHAASRDLLGRLQAPGTRAEDATAAGPAAGPAEFPAVARASLVNWPMALNGLKQTGVIVDFGYEEVGRSGPPHQPCFTLQGYVVLPGGARLQTGPVACHAKKAGQREAAEQLGEILAARGITG